MPFKIINRLVGFALVLWAGIATAQQPSNISVHDPVMIKQDSVYYIFCTGRGITVWSSTDRKNWKREKPVFAASPAWANTIVPDFKNYIWAPDISYHNGLYYLYYAVSAFGKNTSGIGVATSKTLHTDSPDFGWTDRGLVLQSKPGINHYNAIDPNLITDEHGTPYLFFGSFWDGIKAARLQPDLLTPAQPATHLPTLARHKADSAGRGDNAIEAPFVFKKDGWYYLFASIDYCCRGFNSTYKMIVGRSRKVTGPYLDRKGIPMAQGGGTIVLQGDEHWYGVGHNAVCAFDDGDYLIFHGYDAADNGRSKLRMEKITWTTDGWPEVRQ